MNIKEKIYRGMDSFNRLVTKISNFTWKMIIPISLLVLVEVIITCMCSLGMGPQRICCCVYPVSYIIISYLGLLFSCWALKKWNE
jgi:hypothetical protein